MRIQKLLVSFAALLLMLPVGLLAQNMPASQDNQSMPNNSQSNMGNNTQQNTANNSEPQQLIDPAVIYNDKNPGNWVGKNVELKNVMVQDTAKGGDFWVGQDAHHRILVVKPDSNPNVKNLQVHKGDIVTVSGAIQPASMYAARETDTHKGSMEKAENSSGVFLKANDLSIASSTHK